MSEFLFDLGFGFGLVESEPGGLESEPGRFGFGSFKALVPVVAVESGRSKLKMEARRRLRRRSEPERGREAEPREEAGVEEGSWVWFGV